MEIIRGFIEGFTAEPSGVLFDLFTLKPGNLIEAFVVIAILFVMNELIKAYLMIEHTRSAVVHVGINIMTLFPAIFLAVLLLYAGRIHPERVWINLLFAVLTFIPWYMGGLSTYMARRDTEGADIGFMTVGLFIVIFIGVAAAVVF